jgi:hypothetical protein
MSKALTTLPPSPLSTAPSLSPKQEHLNNKTPSLSFHTNPSPIYPWPSPSFTVPDTSFSQIQPIATTTTGLPFTRKNTGEGTEKTQTKTSSANFSPYQWHPTLENHPVTLHQPFLTNYHPAYSPKPPTTNPHQHQPKTFSSSQ